MALVFYLLIVWFALAFFLFMKKQLSIVENIFIFLFFHFVNKNVLTLMSLNLGLMTYSKEPHLFIAYFISRNILGPVLLLIFINKVFRKRWLTRIGYGVAIIGVALCLDKFSISAGIIEYKKWTFFHSFILTILYLFFLYIIASVYRKIKEKGESKFGADY